MEQNENRKITLDTRVTCLMDWMQMTETCLLPEENKFLALVEFA